MVGFLIQFLITVLVLGLIYWIVLQLSPMLPAPFGNIVRVVVIVIIAIVLIVMLLSLLGGAPFLGRPYLWR